MNILVVAHYHYQGIAVPTALFVHEQMRAFVRAGHRVRILVPTPLGKTGEDGKRVGPVIFRKTVDEIEHVFMRFPSFSQMGERSLNAKSAVLTLRLFMKEVLKDFKPDVIHAHKLGANTELGAALKAATGCPLVITSHGETGCEEPWRSDKALVRERAQKADTLICVSSRIQEYLDGCEISVPHWVIMNGFTTEHVIKNGKKEPLSIVQVGHLTRQKRLYLTVEAFKKIRDEYPQATLTIVGKGEERENLEKQCEELGVADAVRFTGEVPNARAMEEMGKAQFFVMPSVNEGFGIVYLEAMASGCVTIGTQGEGISDVITHGKNGFLVVPESVDSIVETVRGCLRDEQLINAVVEAGKQTAEGFSWDHNAKKVFGALSEFD